MSEKRFILKKCKLYDVVYNKDVPIATFKNVDDADVICSWLNELYDQNVQLLIQKTQLQEKNEQLRQQLKEKEEDERLYANEILELRETNKEHIKFKSLGGDY